MLGRLGQVHREDWRDALRRGVQSAAAAVASFAAARALGLGSEFLAVLGAVLILQPSVGGTMGAALSRLQATLVGSVLGFLGLFLLPEGWGTAAALAVAMLAVGTAAGLRSDWSYGAVAAAGMALGARGDLVATALDRGAAIALGAAVGVTVALIVWPDRAEARFERHLRAAMRATATRLSDAVAATMEAGREAAPADHVSAYHKALGLAQESVDAARFVDHEEMRRRLDAVRRLYNSVIILDRAAEAQESPVASAEALRGQVEQLRRSACRVLTALAEGKEPEEEGSGGDAAEKVGDLGGIDAALSRLREAQAEDDPTSDLHRTRNALAFGLHEVRRSLVALIEASRRPGG